MPEFSIEAQLESGAFFAPTRIYRFFLLGGLMVGLCMTYGRLIHNFSTLPNNLTYSGAYPPINSGRIKSARAAIKSVIPADMHPF